MKKLVICILVIVSIIGLTSCKVDTECKDKLRDLEFTVVENVEVPDELKSMIEEKKMQPFKISYNNGEFLYICEGYGEQKTGGYSIQVNSVYETENGICFDSTLIGPSKSDAVTQVLSYPYVVIKLEMIDKNIIFK